MEWHNIWKWKCPYYNYKDGYYIDGYYKHYDEWKKPDIEEYIL